MFFASKATKGRAVRHEGHRCAAIVVQRILAGLDEILLALRGHGLHVGQAAGRKDGYSHLTGYVFTCTRILDVQLVAGVVDIHLVAGDVLHMSHSTFLLHIGAQAGAECRVAVAVRIVGNVFGIQDLLCQLPVAAQTSCIDR